MRVLEINAVPYGSPCRIMLNIKRAAEDKGISVTTASGYSYHPIKDLPANHILVGGLLSKLIHTWLTKLTGYNGCFSIFATRKLLRKIEKEKYNIIHFHNIHGWYLNFPMLTGYIKRHHIKVIWTLHDCWSYTGHCAYYSRINCEKWKNHCHACPQCKEYPAVFVDRSSRMYELKRRWFTGLDVTLVTPSKWLADQVQQSFLKEYPIKVIHNGIDLDVLVPTPNDFREKYRCENKKIVLGVSLEWGIRKGLDVFVELAKRLPNEYQIMLVGGNGQVDRQLPSNVISIHRTQNQQELAEIYTAADVFVNPTREDNFPTVNIEALACGTPVVTFETGGSPEILDETCGIVVPCNDVEALEKAIRYVCEEKPFSQEACVMRAKQFDAKERFNDYVRMYQEEGSRN